MEHDIILIEGLSSEMLCRERFIDVQTDAMMRMVFKLMLRVKG